MISEDIERKLWMALNSAASNLRKYKVGDNGSEMQYAKAYDRLAVAGFVTRLKQKYR